MDSNYSRCKRSGRLIDLFLMFLKFGVISDHELKEYAHQEQVHYKTIRRDLHTIMLRRDCRLKKLRKGTTIYYRLEHVDLSGVQIEKYKKLPLSKKCKDCGTVYTGEDVDNCFHNDKSRQDGKKVYCKTCCCSRSHERWKLGLVRKKVRKQNAFNTNRRITQGPIETDRATR